MSQRYSEAPGSRGHARYRGGVRGAVKSGRRPRLRLGVLFAGVLGLVSSACTGALTAGPALPEAELPRTLEESTDDAFQFPDVTGTPLELTEVDSVSPAREIVESWTLDEQVASLFMVHVPDATLSFHSGIYSNYPVAGFLLLGDNITGDVEESRDFVSSLRTLGDPELLIAVDQEGGAVERLSPDEFPSAPELGEGDLDDTLSVAQERNGLVYEVGANVNLGVVADVSPGEDAYIHDRSYGTDSSLVRDHVEAALGGSIQGVAVTVKHFPGHGITTDDTHQTVASTDIAFDEWRDIHGAPFRVATDLQVPLLMFGHLVVESVDTEPASLSSAWVDLVRDEWGYEGVIVTDDLSMLEDSGDDRYADHTHNTVRALQAGADLIIDSGGLTLGQTEERLADAVQAVVEAVNEGSLASERITESATRLVELRLSLGGVARPLEDAQSG